VITTAVVAELLKNRIPVRQNATKFSMQVLVRVESTMNPYSLLLSAGVLCKRIPVCENACENAMCRGES
jgi:hypothetical protein